MILKVKYVDLDIEKNSVVINEEDLKKSGYKVGDRLFLEVQGSSLVVVIHSTSTIVKPGEVGITRHITLKLEEGHDIELKQAIVPKSIKIIKKKLNGEILSTTDINTLIAELKISRLSNTEISSFVAGSYINDMNMNEIVDMTKSMASTGDLLDWGRDTVVDVHSIGGIAGNKYALLVVPIVAAAGVKIPKTSSRAITSGAGTADVLEVVTNVTLTKNEIMDLIRDTSGCLIWAGGMSLAPVDDMFINVESRLSINPKCLMLSSVMSKKVAMGIKCLVIDIPIGEGAKVKTEAEARKLASSFIELGELLKIKVECIITYGGQPLGRAIGPALEMKEALEALEHPEEAPESLIEKSLSIAGILLELSGASMKGDGMEAAKEILYSGKALDKFREIIYKQYENKVKIKSKSENSENISFDENYNVSEKLFENLNLSVDLDSDSDSQDKNEENSENIAKKDNLSKKGKKDKKNKIDAQNIEKTYLKKLNNLKSEDIKIAKYSYDIVSPTRGYITKVSNKGLIDVVKEAGAPFDKKAGIMLNVKIGNNVKKGDILYTVYSDSEEMLTNAITLARRIYPVNVEGMIIKKVSKF
ncbi:thymidine phosphorylase [Methanococcus voltae]|uniref:AMP phosphorylase n=2 Tax=Methanococcus voltae TaxID=2188 RepID=A0A8J7S584_METVO|nr:thymidine phosphorylase [Methanococcus voltae]MBP2172490.1 AMP phosphorylase [Methanococcus voltae]MBP2201603.1 AMP phosphorylase [Methanococcus voltae]MCS3922392.1 AMP phosphorylase [Methanococcus voltae PS]